MRKSSSRTEAGEARRGNQLLRRALLLAPSWHYVFSVSPWWIAMGLLGVRLDFTVICCASPREFRRNLGTLLSRACQKRERIGTAIDRIILILVSDARSYAHQSLRLFFTPAPSIFSRFALESIWRFGRASRA